MVEEIYILFYDELVKWCTTMTQNHEIAEDIIQETFLRALKNVDVLNNLKKNQCRAWLYRTAKNLYIDKIRHSSHELIKENVSEGEKIESDFDDFYNEELVSKLSDEEKLLFVMRYLQGYNSKELGKMFDLAPATVRSKLSSARKHLRNELEV